MTHKIPISIVLLILSSGFLLAQPPEDRDSTHSLTQNEPAGLAKSVEVQPPANPGFERGAVGQMPVDWLVPQAITGYRITVTDQKPAVGRQCATIVSSSETNRSPFGNLMQLVDAEPYRGKRVRFRAAVRAEVTGKGNQAQMWFRVDVPDEGSSRRMGAFDNMANRPITSDQWNHYEIVGDVAGDAKQIAIGAFLMGEGEAWVDDVSLEIVGDDVAATTRGASEGRRVGTPVDKIKPGLFEIASSTRLTPRTSIWESFGEIFQPRTENPKPEQHTILFPLPLSYRDQVPLSFHLKVSPPEAIQSVDVYQDHGENYVLKLIVNDVRKWKQVDIGFKAVVLVGPSDFGGVPESAEVPDRWPEEAQPWLAATWCADSNNERIQTLGSKIRHETNDVRKIIQLVEQQAGKIFHTATGFGKDLTAVEALDKQGSCTSCANLVAALLRACDVPARVLAGYPSWTGPLQTHYIVEAYVPGYGWYPIESTRCESPWPNTHQAAVAIIPPDYEEVSKAGWRTGIAPGVPYLSLTEMPENTGSVVTTGTVEGARNCDHQCQMIRELAGTAEEWQRALAWAKPRWQAWLKANHELNAEGQLQFGKKSAELFATSVGELTVELEGENP